MPGIGLWEITGNSPEKLKQQPIDLERDLEAWIECNPSLLQEGLTIIGRQIGLDSGRLDLLALDTQGRWVVIEIKSGALRREALAQVLDYASSIATMPREVLCQKVNAYLASRGSSLEEIAAQNGIDSEDMPGASVETRMYLVGTGSDAGLQRMVDYLSAVHNVPISLVSYRVFKLASGQCILMRELSDAESSGSASTAAGPRVDTMAELLAETKRMGANQDFQKLLDAGQRHGFFPRAYKRSVMFTPPNNHSRMLFTLQIRSEGKEGLYIYVSPEAFAEFYAVPEETARLQLGSGGWHRMSAGDIDAFIQGLDRLFASTEQPVAALQTDEA